MIIELFCLFFHYLSSGPVRQYLTRLWRGSPNFDDSLPGRSCSELRIPQGASSSVPQAVRPLRQPCPGRLRLSCISPRRAGFCPASPGRAQPSTNRSGLPWSSRREIHSCPGPSGCSSSWSWLFLQSQLGIFENRIPIPSVFGERRELDQGVAAVDQTLLTGSHENSYSRGERNSSQFAGIDSVLVVNAHQQRLLLESQGNGFRFASAHAEVLFQLRGQLSVPYAPHLDSGLVQSFTDNQRIERLLAAAAFILDRFGYRDFHSDVLQEQVQQFDLCDQDQRR